MRQPNEICLEGNNSTQQATSAYETSIQLINTSNFLGREINVYGTSDNPMFIAKEVAEVLELTNVSDMVSRVDNEEVTKFNLGSRQGETWFLTEDGLYEVLFFG